MESGRGLLRLPQRLLNDRAAAAALAVLLVLALAPASALGAAGKGVTSGEACQRIKPVVTQAWSYSAVQDTAGSAVFIADALGERLLALPLGASNTNLVPVAGQVGRVLAKGWPDAVARQGDGLMVHLQTGERLLRIGPGLNVLGSSPLSELGERGAAVLESMPLWDVTTGGDIIACGDLKRGEVWESGFYRVPADPESAIEELMHYEPWNPLNIFCRLGVDLITTIGETAYFVVMDDPAQIYRQNPGESVPQPLTAFPPLAGAAPDLPALPPREEYAELMQQVEESDMIVGLYSDSTYLYLLYRYHHDGGFDWLLTQIDPGSDKVVGTTTVPSSANHLMAAPGPREWVFVEKGPAKSLGSQDLLGLLRVPTPAIQARLGANLCS